MRILLGEALSHFDDARLMTPELRSQLVAGLKTGSIVPYLGPGVLADVVAVEGGQPMPAESDALILALNGGKPMAPKLMYEFSRAAMHVELKRGRNAVRDFLTQTYAQSAWTRAKLHDWLQAVRPPYVIDINRDTQLQASYADVPHTLIVGVARIGGSDYRFKLFAKPADGAYVEIAPEQADPALPVLFKPMGTPVPEPHYIASDADYVDYITELMGGFAVPAFLKARRQGKRYLLMGLRLTRDTERMVLADLIYGAAQPAGWALIPDPSDKERRFCRKLGLELVESDWPALLAPT